MIKNKKPLFLVLIIFAFYYLLTISIPPFWEDHTFHQRFIQTPITDHIKGIFRIGNDNIFHLERPVLGMYFHATFSLFKYDFFWHQLVKILFTSISSLLLFTLLVRYLNNNTLAFLITLFAYLSYPFFSNFLQYDNPFVFSEFFKVAALFFLLKDISKEKTNLLNQILIILFAIFAFRSYNQAWSIVGVIILFTTLYNHKLIKRYTLLFAALILYNFPLNILSVLTKKASYSDQAENYGTSFLKFFYKTVEPFYNPLYLPDSLYYISLTEILSFFGILLILVTLVLLIIKYFEKKIGKMRFFTNKKQDSHSLILLSVVWITCEIPLWYIAPDPTVRYLSGIMIPLFIIIFCAINTIHTSLRTGFKRPFISIITILLMAFLLTNITYAYLFRITWGSAFIGYAKVNDYLEETRASNAYVLYYAGTVARLLFPLDKQSDQYTFKQDVIYEKGGVEDFKEANIRKLKKQYKEVYIIKSKSAFGNSEYPPVAIEQYKNLKEIKEIKGKTNDFVDKITERITRKFGIMYNFYTFKIYNVT